MATKKYSNGCQLQMYVLNGRTMTLDTIDLDHYRTITQLVVTTYESLARNTFYQRLFIFVQAKHWIE